MAYKKDTVLIFSPSDDIHAIAVKRRLEEISQGGANIEIIDLATSCRSGSMTFEIGPQGTRTVIEACKGLPFSYGAGALSAVERSQTKSIDFSRVRGIWWRRPRPPVAPRYGDKELEGFAATNVNALAQSIVLNASNETTVINDPARETVANHKLLQLSRARLVGLNIPLTCITHSASEASRFIESCQSRGTSVIYKILRSSNNRGHYTQLFNEGDRHRIDQINGCPVILQEGVMNGTDVRVVVTGNKVFAATATALEPLSYPDIRSANTTQHAVVQVPSDVSSQLLALQKSFGLRTAVYDFMIDATGRWIFLEINPTGQWLFLETKVGARISEAFASLLWYGEVRSLDSCSPPFDDQALNRLLPLHTSEVFDRALASEPVRKWSRGEAALVG